MQKHVEQDAPRERGRIVRWTDRGFGFIRPDGAAPYGQDLFVHVTAIAGTEAPSPGHAVTFERASEEDGRWRAVRVVIQPEGGR